MIIFEFLLICLVLIIFSLLFFEWRLRCKSIYKTVKFYPGPPVLPIVGNLFDILGLNQVDLFKYPRNMAKKYKRSYRGFILGEMHINIIRAKEVEAILSTIKHTDKSLAYQFLHQFLGTGLLTSNGEKWLSRRKILTPTFHFNILEKFQNIFQEETQRLTLMLKDPMKRSNEIEVMPIITQLTLNIISETAMGVKLRDVEGSQKYKNQFFEIVEILIHRFTQPILTSENMWKISGYKSKLDKLLVPVHKFTSDIVEDRRRMFLDSFDSNDVLTDIDENIYISKKRRYAMLDTLLVAEMKGLINDEGIREEVDTFMFEGHDTTSAGLVFTLLLLAHHPEAQEGILNELYEIQEQSGFEKKISVSVLNNLKYLDRVIKECLRLYPPVPYFARTATENFELDGYIFPKDTFIHFHVFDLHRDPIVFQDPEKFDPDRFLPENVAQRNSFAYIPFSAGSRNCIGQKFALLEMKTTIIEILRNFQLTPVTKREDIVFVADLVLRSETPIKIKFTLREK